MATVATTGGGSSHGSREARRRRIIERGSDRLALITGRIQSLPPDPYQSRSSTFSPVQTPADPAQHEDETSNSSLPNKESSSEPGHQHIFNETVQPLPHNSDKGGSFTSRSVALHDTNQELSPISSSMQSPVQNHQHEQSHRISLTSGKVCSAIAASENIRMCCSVAAAILVILSNIGFPMLGFHNIKGIIMFRPLYLLLLTNISIVLGRVILGTQGVELRTGQMSCGNALVGRLDLMQNIVRALFMDFSIYMVVLVSGLALVRGFRW